MIVLRSLFPFRTFYTLLRGQLRTENCALQDTAMRSRRLGSRIGWQSWPGVARKNKLRLEARPP